MTTKDSLLIVRVEDGGFYVQECPLRDGHYCQVLKACSTLDECFSYIREKFTSAAN